MCSINLDNRKCLFEESFTQWSPSVPSGKAYIISPIPLDQEGKCVFHSSHKNWKRENLFPELLKSFIRLSLNDEAVKAIRFHNVYFISKYDNASIELNDHTFTKELEIKHSLFIDKVDWRNTRFEAVVELFNNAFFEETYFNDTVYQKRTRFNNCTFGKAVYFNDAKFITKEKEFYISFTDSVFKEQANFSDTQFIGETTDVNFQIANFEGHVYFRNSLFEMHALFNGSHFHETADFRAAKFIKGAEFNIRVLNDKRSITEFNKVIFSDAEFSDTIDFYNVKMGDADFKNASVSAGLMFRNSHFESSNFDDMRISSNSIVIFQGEGQNKVFSKPVSFRIRANRIKGSIRFENVKLSYISSAQLIKLKKLESDGKVLFVNCEFDANILILRYTIAESTANYDLYVYIFQHLDRWISKFTKKVQASLEIEEVSIPRREVAIKVKYLREEDYLLVQTLTKYYFKSINKHSSNLSETIIKKITGADFLKDFFKDENTLSDDIDVELKKIIEEVVSYFELKIHRGIKYLQASSNTKALKQSSNKASRDQINIPQLLQNIETVCQALNEKADLIKSNLSITLPVDKVDGITLQFIINNFENMTNYINKGKGIMSVNSEIGTISQQFINENNNSPIHIKNASNRSQQSHALPKKIIILFLAANPVIQKSLDLLQNILRLRLA